MFLGVARLASRNNISQRVRAAFTDRSNVILGQALHLATTIDTSMSVGIFDFFPLRGGQVIGRARSHCGTPAIGFGLYPVRMRRVPVGMLLAQGHPVRCIIRRTLGIHQRFVLPVAGLASRLFFCFMRLFIRVYFVRIFAFPCRSSRTNFIAIVRTIHHAFLTLTQDAARGFAIVCVLVGAERIKRLRNTTFGTDFERRGFHRHLLTKVEVSTWLPTELAAET